jgi:hypothetical protein
MSKRIENFLKNLTIYELKEVRNMAANLIHTYADGFQYECKVHSYGRSWTEKLTNSFAVQEHCYEYNGDNGIIHVYTNNPNLNIENYGITYYFPSMEDAENWRNYDYIKNHIPQWEEAVKEWENRENIPFRERPSFAPYITKEDIEAYKKEIQELEKTVIMPKILDYTYSE